MNNNLLLGPVLIPLLGAALALVIRRVAVQRVIGVATCAIHLLASLAVLVQAEVLGVQALRVGDWPAPFSIVFVADVFGSAFLVTGSLITLLVAIQASRSVDEGRVHFGFFTYYLAMLAGVSGSFLTGDLFNLFVWFEVMLMSSFVLLALGGEGRVLSAAIKYVSLNLIASSLFLVALGLLFGQTGTLNFADLAVKVRQTTNPHLLALVSVFFITAFLLKAGVYPFSFWLPAAYPAPPPIIGAVFAGLLTKVGIYALARGFSLVFWSERESLLLVLGALGSASVVVGGLGAIAQSDFRRMLSFNIVGHVGVMVIALATWSADSIAGMLFYAIHHMILMTGLFLSSEENPGEIRPWTILMLFSLVGLPPLSGFIGKWLMLREAALSAPLFVIPIVVGSLLTLISVLRYWYIRRDLPTGNRPTRAVVKVLAMASIVIPLVAGPLMRVCIYAGDQIVNPQPYINAVLHPETKPDWPWRR